MWRFSRKQMHNSLRPLQSVSHLSWFRSGLYPPRGQGFVPPFIQWSIHQSCTISSFTRWMECAREMFLFQLAKYWFLQLHKGPLCHPDSKRQAWRSHSENTAWHRTGVKNVPVSCALGEVWESGAMLQHGWVRPWPDNLEASEVAQKPHPRTGRNPTWMAVLSPLAGPSLPSVWPCPPEAHFTLGEICTAGFTPRK